MISDTQLEAFESIRPLLVRIAYRMVGTLTESEDLVQDTFLRWVARDGEAVGNPTAFLRQTVVRLCLDHLKSARVRREVYPGPWLPEPWVMPELDLEDAKTPLVFAMMERLSPLERAAFLLHDVFDVDYSEIAQTLDRDTAACRQLVSRARAHLKEDRVRFPVDESEGMRLLRVFHQASRSGDLSELNRVLAQDVILYSDGGGKVPAALNPIYGRDKVGRLFAGISKQRSYAPPVQSETGWLEGLPTMLTIEHDGVRQTTSIELNGLEIIRIYIVRNPEKTERILVS